jgi:hypothetical protein
MLACRRILQGLSAAVSLLAGAVAAAESSGSGPGQFSISPFVGYRVGGGFTLNDTGQHISLAGHGSFAVAFDVRAEEGTEYELFYSRQATSLGGNGFVPVGTIVEYLHVGGTVPLEDIDRLKPYFGGGLGVTRLSPGLAPGSEDTRFSMSLALGLRAPVNKHLSLRLEARGYLTLMNTSSAVFCHSDQGGALCQVRASGSSMLQGDFLAGATFTF